VPAIREAVRQVNSQLAIERPQLLSDVLDRSLSRQRMMGTLVGLFGAVALILATITGIAASVVPALRAMRVDPVIALRRT
jgi:ABC-type antimicrobial peptide transport system permease subunit